MKSAKKKLKVHEYNAVFQAEEDGGYSVWIPALPGCASQGDTFEAATENIKEAIGLYLEDTPNSVKAQDEKGLRQFLVPIQYNYA